MIVERGGVSLTCKISIGSRKGNEHHTKFCVWYLKIVAFEIHMTVEPLVYWVGKGQSAKTLLTRERYISNVIDILLIIVIPPKVYNPEQDQLQ